MKILKKSMVILLTFALLFTVGCAKEANAVSPQNEAKNQIPLVSQEKGNRQKPQNGERLLSYFTAYVESGILTQDDAENLVQFMIENEPDNQGQKPNSQKPNPFMDAATAGIITSVQAEALKDVLLLLGPDNQTSNNQQTQDDQDLSNNNQNRGSKQTLSSGVSVSQANEIEAKLAAEVQATSKINGYPIVDTNTTSFYSNSGKISEPNEGESYYGQDATYTGSPASYTDNGDGTVTDNVTGLMWQQDPGVKMTWEEAVDNLQSFNLGRYDDWRLPTIKELYSLVQFSGETSKTAEESTPFLDTDYFVFHFGDPDNGERVIDSQMATRTIYDTGTMNNNATMFGFNFADGRIKGYPTSKTFYVYYVRGNTSYGQNQFVDNGDGTISDLATGLMWMMDDSAAYHAGDANDGTMDWGDSLEWCEDLAFAGYDDWKLPDAKELQSIVDYKRAPDTTNSAAIDEIFNASVITNCFGNADYGFYWTSTTHLDGRNFGDKGVYVAFGRGNGQMNNQEMDVHGAGCQRSDDKTGDREDYPTIFELAPQGDEQRVFNLVRAVRIIKN